MQHLPGNEICSVREKLSQRQGKLELFVQAIVYLWEMLLFRRGLILQGLNTYSPQLEQEALSTSRRTPAYCIGLKPFVSLLFYALQSRYKEILQNIQLLTTQL